MRSHVSGRTSPTFTSLSEDVELIERNPDDRRTIIRASSNRLRNSDRSFGEREREEFRRWGEEAGINGPDAHRHESITGMNMTTPGGARVQILHMERTTSSSSSSSSSRRSRRGTFDMPRFGNLPRFDMIEEGWSSDEDRFFD